MSVNVDNSSIETNSDSLRVKDSGITLTKMANLADMKVIGNISGGSTTPSAVSILDEDNMSSNSNTSIATQQSIKSYIDSVASGLDIKDSCRVATTANITLSGIQTIDVVSVAAGNRVLVKDQSTGSENGIYICVDGGGWTRSTDFDGNDEVTAGVFTFIEEGTINGDFGFVLTTNDSITVGSTALSFTQFSGAGQITAGSGLSKSGNSLLLDLKSNGGAVIESTKLALDLGASSIEGTLAVGDGGTGATSFDDKAVIITQDSGTDTLAAVVMDASGELLIGGTSGPAVATLTQGSNVTITNDDGSITIASTDTNTQLTTEQVQDIAGPLIATSGTKTGITITYQDADGDMDFTVSDTTVAGNTGSTGMTPGDTLTIAGGTNATTAMSGDTLTVNVDDAFLKNNADDTTTGTITIDKSSSATATVTNVLTLQSQSTGTPANNIGVGMAFGIETAAGNVETGARIEAVVTDVSDSDEDIDLVFYTMESGDAADEALRIHDDGNLTVAGDLTITGGNITNAITFDAGITNAGTIAAGAWGGTTIPVNKGGTGATNAGTARTNLGLGTSAILDTGISDGNVLTANDAVVDDDFLRINGTEVEGRTAAEVLSDIGAQALDSDLTAIAALSSTGDGNFIVGSAGGWVSESAGTARTSLELGTIATQASTNVNIDGGDISGVTISGGLTWGANQDLVTYNLTTGGKVVIDIDSAVTPGTSATGINAAGSITLGAGNDAGLYVQGDNLYVENKTQNKDIIFRIKYGNDYTTAMTINGDAANVGIGTGTPTEKLEVFPNTDNSAIIGRVHVGSVGHVDHAGFSHIDRDTTTSYALMQSYDGSTFINAAASQHVYFKINNSEKMKLTSSGEVIIGTGTPTEKLEVFPDTDNSAIIGKAHVGLMTGSPWTNAAGFSHIDHNGINSFSLVQTSAGATRLNSVTGQAISFRIGNVPSMTLNSDKSLDVVGDITAFSSDKRLKTNIEVIESPLEKINKLSGFTYHWNKEKCKEAGFKPKDEGQIGVFAQDVQEVIPEAVKIAPFDQDENGESKSGDNYLTVQYEKIIPLLIECIKEQQVQINELKNKILL